MHQFKNLIELQKYFKNELICAKYLEQQRWGGTPTCPHCGSEHHYRTKTRLRHPELKDYKDFVCKACRKKYTLLTGSIYEGSKVSLIKWIMAMYQLISSKKGISSIKLASDIGVSQKTAWFINHRLRAMFEEKAPERLVNEVEVDETFVGGKNKNRHWDKKVEKSRGRSFKDKTPVLGMLQRGGKLKCVVVPNTSAKVIAPLIVEHVQRGATLYTDDWKAYKSMHNFYDHQIVDHGRKQYKNGNACTNAIEGFWGIFKRGIIGIYNWVSPKHLQKYCDEFTFRYNNRSSTVIEMFEAAVRCCGNTRLLYKVLTG